MDLSVCMVCYNHVKYIEQSIKSVLMQKTKYSFELLIIDDCSTDGSDKIIQKYQRLYPDIIHATLLKENVFQTDYKASLRIIDQARGKYINSIEGDDYWIDPYKIEKQLNFLFSHPDYLAVTCRCQVVNEKSKIIEEYYPDCRHAEYSIDDWLLNILPGQTATIMRVNPLYRKDIDWSLLRKGLVPGDRLTCYVLALNGKVHCIQQVMSAYRHVINSGKSFSATNKYNYRKDENWYGELVKYTYKNGTRDNILNAEALYFENIMRGIIKGHQANIGELFHSKYTTSGVKKILKRLVKRQIALHLNGNR